MLLRQLKFDLIILCGESFLPGVFLTKMVFVAVEFLAQLFSLRNRFIGAFRYDFND